MPTECIVMKRVATRLEKLLLEIGGERCIIPVIEEDAVDILKRGFTQKAWNVVLSKGQACRCHQNASQLWDANKKRVQLLTGYSLSKDGIWRAHSWCRDLTRLDEVKRPRIIETTNKRLIYFGFVMTAKESEAFYYRNVS